MEPEHCTTDIATCCRRPASRTAVQHPFLTMLIEILLLGTLVRGAFLDQNMRYDESQTLNQYVSQAPGELFHYSQLNNHLLHSLLVVLDWVTTLAAGAEPCE